MAIAGSARKRTGNPLWLGVPLAELRGWNVAREGTREPDLPHKPAH